MIFQCQYIRQKLFIVYTSAKRTFLANSCQQPVEVMYCNLWHHRA